MLISWFYVTQVALVCKADATFRFMLAFMVMIDVTVVRVGLLVNIHSALGFFDVYTILFVFIFFFVIMFISVGFMYEVEINIMDASVFYKTVALCG